MSFDVVVVGGGIGGLTTAALLSARGLNVCLLERQSDVGGCISDVQHHGLSFEPGFGLYTSWGDGEIYDRTFSELQVAKPEVKLLPHEVVVRLQEDDITLKKDASFNDELRDRFPECADEAIKFYALVGKLAAQYTQASAVQSQSKSAMSKAFSALRGQPRQSTEFLQARNIVTSDYTRDTSNQFVSFIDSQLRLFLQTSIDECAFLPACVALSRARGDLYTITGGPSILGKRLAEAFKSSGGTLRLNSPVLRLAYNNSGDSIGVDLLSGEQVPATRAIVSNMTVWDTYGKLIGLNRTPPQIKKDLNTIVSSGVFQIFALMEPRALVRIPSERLLVHRNEDNEFADFFFATAVDDKEENIAVTITSTTEVDQWFTFQQSEEDSEARDQQALEQFWLNLHKSMPELGSDIEVLETASPRTYYDQTRRKLGQVMGYQRLVGLSGLTSSTTSIPNLFLVGDTASNIASLDSITHAALELANMLTS